MILSSERRASRTADRRFSSKAVLIGVLLGKRIQIARLHRQWSETEAAERANMSRATLRKVENGDPGVVAGALFSLAALLGVSLVDAADEASVEAQIRLADMELATLSKRIREPQAKLKDDF